MQISGVHYELAQKLVLEWAAAPNVAECLSRVANALQTAENDGKGKCLKEWASIILEEARNSSNSYKKRGLQDLAERMRRQIKVQQ